MRHLLLSIIYPPGRKSRPMTHSSYQAICSKALDQVKEDSDGSLYHSRGYVKCELWHVLVTDFRVGQIRVLEVDLFLRWVLAFAERNFGLAVIVAKILVSIFIAPFWLALCSLLLRSLRVDQKASCMALLQPL